MRVYKEHSVHSRWVETWSRAALGKHGAASRPQALPSSRMAVGVAGPALLLAAGLVIADASSSACGKGVGTCPATTGVASVPVIDIGAITRERLYSPEALKAVGQQLADSVRNGSAGFMTVINHGLERHLPRMQQVAQDFFAWPTEDKLALAPHQFNSNNSHRFRGYTPASVNGKELLDATNPEFGRVPRPRDGFSSRALLTEPSACLPGEKTTALCDELDDHWRRMQSLGELLLRAISVGLNDDAEYFVRAIREGGQPISCLRFNHYPVFTKEQRVQALEQARHAHKEGLACEEHRDMTLLTLLDQGDVGGLQVRQQGAWKDVPLTPHALVINVSLCKHSRSRDPLYAKRPCPGGCLFLAQPHSAGSSRRSVAGCRGGRTTHSSQQRTACVLSIRHASPSRSLWRLATTPRWTASLRRSPPSGRALTKRPSTALTSTTRSSCSRSMPIDEVEEHESGQLAVVMNRRRHGSSLRALCSHI